MAYTLCKKIITNAAHTRQEQKDEMQQKLDVFLLHDRISQENYNELTALLASKPIAA